MEQVAADSFGLTIKVWGAKTCNKPVHQPLEPMGDAPAPSEGTGASRFRSTLKAIGGKAAGVATNVASSVSGTVVSAAGTVAKSATSAAGTVAKSATSVVDAVKPGAGGRLAHSDFAHIKSVNKLARERDPRDSRDKRYSEAEWADAERRADAVLSQLWDGYFEEGFDPVQHELQQLSADAGPEDIDVLVDKLTTGVEKVTGKLARHVFKKRDQLIAGITAVTAVEDDLKAAFMISRSSRACLRQSEEEILRNMRVVSQTRRKRHCLELLEVCSKIQRMRSLQQSLKRAQEQGEYGEAMLMCIEGFHSVEGLQQLKVAVELRASVQRLYVDTLLRVDAALTVICGEFDPERYSKVLEAYMLQSISGQELAEKVLQSFVDAVCDATARVVRALLMTKPSIVEKLSAGGSLEGSYAQLCAALPSDLVRPSLVKQLQVLFDIMASYHVMARWHMDYLQQQQQRQQEGGGWAAAGTDTEQQNTIYGFLSSVAQALATSRTELFDLAILRITEVLNHPSIFKGDGFVEVVTWERRFISAGEAFVGSEATDLRAALTETSGHLFAAYHNSNIEAITQLLHSERWRHVDHPGLEPSINLGDTIIHSPAYTPAFSEQGAIGSFDDWIASGNPFANVTGSLTSTPQKQSRPSPARSLSAQVHSTSAVTGQNQVQDHSAVLLATAAASAVTPWHTAAEQQATMDPHSSPSAATPPSRRAGASGADKTPSGQASTSGAGEGRHVITVSSGRVLKCIKVYGQLIRPLAAHSVMIFHAMCELFDHYMLSCFILFGGVTLETLVFQDDIIPTRLRAAILRILTAPNSRYKHAVEELQRMKPQMTGRAAASTAPTSGMGFLDRFANRMESLATDLERSVAGMQQRLNDRVQSIQMPVAIASVAGELASAVDRVNALAGAPSSSNLYGLQERIIATESLMHMADELKAGKQALLAVLPQESQREAEAFFSPHGSVEAAKDLRHALLRGAARKLLAGMLDEDRGTAQQIANTNYNLREPLTAASAWAPHAVRSYAQLKELLAPAGLPDAVVLQVWDAAMATGAEAVVDGLSRVRRCTFEGRASMSYDLSYLERAVRALAPQGFSGSFRSAELYIKAFYLPWEELTRWCQVHLAEYGKHRVAALVQVVCDAYQISRGQRQELLGQIEEFDCKFSH